MFYELWIFILSSLAIKTLVREGFFFFFPEERANFFLFLYKSATEVVFFHVTYSATVSIDTIWNAHKYYFS